VAQPLDVLEQLGASVSTSTLPRSSTTSDVAPSAAGAWPDVARGWIRGRDGFGIVGRTQRASDVVAADRSALR
jgi:hypothetical protein